MKRWFLLAVSGFLGSCAGPDEPLTVKQFYLRDQKSDSGNDPMVDGEKMRRMYGAVSMEERRERLGQYYTILWQDGGSGPVEVVFEFQQGATGSLVKTRRAEFAPDAVSGKAEFEVIGDDYFKGGKVLAWKATLRRNGAVLASKRSYLWRD